MAPAPLGRARVDLRLMDAQALDFPDAAFDAVVTSCVFCGANINRETVANLRQAGVEVQEVRPLVADIVLLITAERPAE